MVFGEHWRGLFRRLHSSVEKSAVFICEECSLLKRRMRSSKEKIRIFENQALTIESKKRSEFHSVEDIVLSIINTYRHLNPVAFEVEFDRKCRTEFT